MTDITALGALPKKLRQKDIESIDVGLRDDIIRAAWDDGTPFESIQVQYGLSETQVMAIMKFYTTDKMFAVWRGRVEGRPQKYLKLTTEKSSALVD